MQNNYIQNYIDLSGLNGLLFSTITIDKLVDDEYRHDRIVVRNNENDCLSTMSSGQQKKALLSYLISLKPDYLVLDDVYSNVDADTQHFINSTLTELSQTTLIIQVMYRKRDLLPFINQVLHIDDNSIITKKESSKVFVVENQLASTQKFELPDYFKNAQLKVQKTLIEINSLNVSYEEKKVLNRINWQINSGEFWQLIGPNGSGKSTLLSIITGDNPKAYGQDITLFGMKKGSGETIWDIKKNIGYFTPRMLEHFTRNETIENMLISGFNDSLGLYIQPTDIQKEIAKSWIKMLGNSFRNKSFQQLSVGQQRMVMVARAIIKNPALLILDEPTIELDDDNSKLFIEMINAIASQNQMAIIYVSHRNEDSLKPTKKIQLVKTEAGYTNIIED